MKAFGDGPRNLELWPRDWEDITAGITLTKLPNHANRRIMSLDSSPSTQLIFIDTRTRTFELPAMSP
ncbi:hypothetical protein TNCV_1105121 [Trichonephila clavipes]|nr:hypothetical protein TNCV_1105121 [Trichonephila clavipes]